MVSRKPLYVNGKLVGFVCDVAGNHVRDKKINLLDMELKVIGEPKRAWDAGDCGQWEIPVECPKCGQGAIALQGYMFAHEQNSICCEHCGFKLDQQQLDRQEEINSAKELLSRWNDAEHSMFEGEITDWRAEEFIINLNKFCRWMHGQGYVFCFQDSILRAFALLVEEQERISKEAEEHIKKVLGRT